MRKDQADPSPNEMLGRQLQPGMITYYRVMHRGDVAFKQDEILIELVPNDGNPNHQLCIHFRTRKHTLVCYYVNGRVWARGPFDNLEEFDVESKKG